VRLVGGKGLWLVDIQVLETDRTRPHWHWLLRRVKARDTVTVPSHHAMVGCYSGSVQMNAWDGSSLRVAASPVPVMGPLTVLSTGTPRPATWLFSGWYG
jgi:hypothetical protein